MAYMDESRKEVDTRKAYTGCSFLDSHDTFAKCDCGAEAVVVSDDSLSDYDPKSGIIFVCLWAYGNSCRKLGWKERIRWCWAILRFGLPWLDEVCLKPERAKELGEDLINRANKYLTK